MFIENILYNGQLTFYKYLNQISVHFSLLPLVAYKACNMLQANKRKEENKENAKTGYEKIYTMLILSIRYFTNI